MTPTAVVLVLCLIPPQVPTADEKAPAPTRVRMQREGDAVFKLE